jgi:predicted dehydrogenase
MKEIATEMKQLNVGVIGAGKMGLLHAGIFNNLEGCVLSAVVENNRFVSSTLKKYLPHVTIYKDFEKMYEKESLDIIVITTPVFLHKAMLETSLDYNLHIFVEKPMALNYGECLDILKKNNGRATLVGYCRRFMGTYKLAKKIIDSTILGSPYYFQSQLFVGQIFDQGKGWQYDPTKSGGGVLIDLGSHAIDLLHYFFGDIISLQAMGRSAFNERVEDYVSVNLSFKKNVFGSLQLSWSIRNYRLPELKIIVHFDKGSLVVTEKYIELFSEIEKDIIKKGWNTFYKQNITDKVPIDLGGPEYTLEDMHFIECIRENKETLCNFKEAAKTNQVIDKIYSSMNHNYVELIERGGD